MLVTANYKLTFDALRRELSSLDVWLLVVDSRGINVWCAAGKKSFSAEEISYQVKRCQLEEVVKHRRLILPQLCANGVNARKIKDLCGFRGRFGPISASHLPAFLASGECDEAMRSVTFSIKERLVLIPLEICMLWKKLLVTVVLFFFLSGIGPHIYSFSEAFQRGSVLFFASLVAIFSGAVVTPLLLPWLPFRQFWLKGTLTGTVSTLLFLPAWQHSLNSLEYLAVFFWIISCSSFLAMNFTGSTPFTSLSGVEKEMKRGLPVQICVSSLALILWLSGSFL